MNANAIITEDMTLEERLKAIDDAVAAAMAQATGQSSSSSNGVVIQDDPQNLLMCEGCQ